MRHGGIHDVFDRNAKFFQCHVQLVALRLRDALVGFANVDQGGRFGILNIAQRRDLHIVLPVIPRLALEVELAIGLDVGLRIHRNPVHRAGATRNSLEAVGVRQGPIRPVAARAPAHHAELGRVGHAARDQRINAGHDVVEALAEIIAGNLHAKFLAIIIGAAVIGLEDSIAAAGKDVHVGAVAAGEAIHVSASRTAVKLDNQGIAFPFLIVRGISQDAFDHLPVGAFPVHGFVLSELQAFYLGIGTRDAHPARALAHRLRPGNIVVAGRGRVSEREHEQPGFVIEAGATDDAALVGQLRQLAVSQRNAEDVRINADALGEIKRLRVRAPGGRLRVVVPIGRQLAQRAAGDRCHVQLLVAAVRKFVGRAEDQPLAVG